MKLKKAFQKQLAALTQFNELAFVQVLMRNDILTAAPYGGLTYRTEMVPADEVLARIESGSWHIVLRNEPPQPVVRSTYPLRADI